MGKLFDEKVHLFDDLVYEKDVYEKGPGYDPDLIALGMMPVTAQEQEGMDLLPDLDLDLLSHKLTSIVEEGRDVYMSLSISEGIITGDMNCGIFTASGDPSVVATGIYFHALLNYAQVRYIRKYYENDPTVGLKDGDIFFFNDELGGGHHTFDMFTSMPVFYEGELIAWVACGGHQGDTGSISPGGFAPKATERWHEGLHVPVLRIGEHDEIRRDILDFMCASVRNPFVFAADLKARVATCIRMRERILREVERRGAHVIVGGMRKILDTSAHLARGRLRELNDGIYRSVLFNDEAGIDTGLTRLPITVIKEGDEMTVLAQGISPSNHAGPMQTTWHLVRAATAVYLFSYFFRGLPRNAGLLDPVKVLIEGPSIANSPADVPHGNGGVIALTLVQSLHVAGSKTLFDSPYREAVSAPQSGNINLYVFAGENRRGYPTANFTGSANASGQGARFDLDGEHALGFYWGPWTDSGEVEDTDSRLPPLVLARVFDKNNHGFGMYRGGSPLVEISTAFGHQGCMMTSWGGTDRLSHNPGMFGGYSGPPNPRFVIRDTNLLELMARAEDLPFSDQHDLLSRQPIEGRYIIEPSSVGMETFSEGDVFVSNVGAGGGYGDVLDRDPKRVLEDLQGDLITSVVAVDVYGVVVDEGTGDVDVDATERRRQEIRDERLREGKPFDQFIEGWLQQSPPAEILRYYGHWPEPRLERYDKPFWGMYG